jgi:oligopeptide/dipeptide ABC transporter ATP-binding protein
MKAPLLNVKDLTVTYRVSNGFIRALRGVSFRIYEREFVAVVGESGSGKSTLGLTIIGLLPNNAIVNSGEVIYKGVNLLSLDRRVRERFMGSEIGMIFQNPMNSLRPTEKVSKQFIDTLKVAEARGSLKLEAYDYSKPWGVSGRFSALIDRVLGVSKRTGSGLTTHDDKYRLEALKWLKLVRIPDPESVLEKYPFQLSGGMMQRIMIAMALSLRPSLLIADEPTTALDVITQAQVLKLMRGLIDEVGASILLITHDMGVAAQVADRVLVLYAGELVEEAPVHELFKNPMHPYTIGLLNSIPRGHKSTNRLSAIRGFVPDLRSEIRGCVFADRCDYATEVCRINKPSYIKVNEDHVVRCFLYGK